MRGLKYFLVVLLAIGVAHLAWSAAVVAVLNSLFDHKVLNVKNVDNVARQWEDMTSVFVVRSIAKAKRAGKPLVMFLGSSVTYGVPWQERVIFSSRVAESLPDRKVTNLSIIGAGMRGLTDFATCALNDAHHPDILIVEMPLVNSTSSVISDAKYKPRECASAGDRVSGYWPLALERAYGPGWISILWDDQAYEKPEADIQIARVPANYFADRQAFELMESVFISELRRYLSAVSTMGHRVYAYVSPIYTPAIDEVGGDTRAVEYQIALANRVCKEFERIICLDSSIFNSKRELFYNLTHLNQRGHRALADWFVGKV